MIAFCPRCGAELPLEFKGEWFETGLRCGECGVAVTAIPHTAARSDEEEVEYDLGGWPVSERGMVSAALVEAGIPYRWETGIVLVVAADAEEEVDGLLDDVGGAAPDETGTEVEVEDEDDGGDGGEQAHAAMSDLFVGADRLQHAPGDERVAAELAGAAATAGACRPPYGIEPQVWRRIQGMASAVVAASEEADDDAVAVNARALRNFLRDYV